MFKRILVPVDGSEAAGKALTQALEFAREQQARLRLVHVVDESPICNFQGTDDAFEALRDSLCQSGRNILARDKEEADRAGVEADTKLFEVLCGRPSALIVNEAKAWPADLIIMGTHGRSGFDHLLMGSVAEGVVRTAGVPVLLIRGQ